MTKKQEKPSEQAGKPKARDYVDVSGVTCTVAYDIQGKYKELYAPAHPHQRIHTYIHARYLRNSIY